MPCGPGAALGVADVLRDHVASLRLSPEQSKAAAHIIGCRTGRFGGQIADCDRCGGRHYAYHSCRDRHCPRCGGLDQALWAEAQQQHLLPVTYFHLVFTMPASLRPFFLRNGRALALDALFAAVSETILEVGATKGWQLGVLAVLHTWNQRLDDHPHVHCLVPGCGYGKDGSFAVMKRFLLSYKQLRIVFKAKLLQRLRALVRDKALSVSGAAAQHLLNEAGSRVWNLKVKRAFAGADTVIKYFARYVRRIAISDSRLVAYDGKTVTFRYRDRQDRNRAQTTTMEASRFCEMFLKHVLPPRFVRIRRFGLLSNRGRKTHLIAARAALKAPEPPPIMPESRSAACLRIFGKDPTRCTKCGEGRLVVVDFWPPTRLPITTVLAFLQSRAP